MTNTNDVVDNIKKCLKPLGISLLRTPNFLVIPQNLVTETALL